MFQPNTRGSVQAEGYGGIAYKSMFTDDGFNLAFFDSKILTQLSGELRETKKVRVAFGDAMDEYVVDDKGRAVRAEIVAIGPAPKK